MVFILLCAKVPAAHQAALIVFMTFNQKALPSDDPKSGQPRRMAADGSATSTGFR